MAQSVIQPELLSLDYTVATFPKPRHGSLIKSDATQLIEVDEKGVERPLTTLLPKRFVSWADEWSVISQSVAASISHTDTNYRYEMFRYWNLSTSHSMNARISCVLQGGTNYTIKLLLAKFPSAGIVRVLFNGVQKLSVDGYNAGSTIYNQVGSATGQTLSEGYQEIDIICDSHNASSSARGVVVTKLWIYEP